MTTIIKLIITIIFLLVINRSNVDSTISKKINRSSHFPTHFICSVIKKTKT
ncbi:hypothetical protein RND81_02G196100 [Saponaria officinalis]|uniref:Uncharacterized protein n=1 Tax=Saponaria officinalis TaxID=3572 RepID=A0AAW1MZ37_SAPOF